MVAANPVMNDDANTTEQYSGTKPVPQNLKFDHAQVSAYLHDEVEGFEGPFTVTQFRGGQSNPTYLIEARSGQYVMRRKPPGALLPSAHAVDREYRVCKALHEIGFAVPRPYCLCEDESVAGTIFYVMEFVSGRVFWDGSLPGEAPSARRAIYDAFGATLAALHNVDYEAIGLGDYGRPGNYFARQISRWSKQFVASSTQSVATMDRLMEWLPKNIPEEDSISLVHGDFSLHNVMFHPHEPQVIAVLDWEISTVGHPLADLTYNMLAWYAPSTPGAIGSLEGIDLTKLGIPTMDQYLARYCELTGRGHVEGMDYYRAYNLFRLAAILQGIVGRVRDGTASNDNAEAMAAHVKPLSELGWHFALRAGAN